HFISFTDTATPEIYTLSLHDALPILFFRRRTADGRDEGAFRGAERRAHRRRLLANRSDDGVHRQSAGGDEQNRVRRHSAARCRRSEEHTSELQSRENLVCRLLLEKKK